MCECLQLVHRVYWETVKGRLLRKDRTFATVDVRDTSQFNHRANSQTYDIGQPSRHTTSYGGDAVDVVGFCCELVTIHLFRAGAQVMDGTKRCRI